MKNKITITAAFVLLFAASGFSQAITPPYSDDFEGANAGWTTTTVFGSNWQSGLPTTPPLNTAHSGVNAWDVELNANYASNTECYLVSPEFDFSTIVNATLRFWQNRQTEIGWDGGRMDYSVNNGVTWTVLGFYNDPLGVNWFNAGGLGSSGLSGWDGNSNGWIQSTYDLSLLDGLPSVRLRFAFDSDATTNMAGFSIDDFEITVPSILDAGVVAITSPDNSTQSGTVSPVHVVITNDGLNILTALTISYELNGTVQGSFSWTGVLAPGNTDTAIVGTLLVPAGTYQVCANTVLAGDGNPANDTLCVSITNTGGGFSLSVTDSLGYINCVGMPVHDQFYIQGSSPAINNGDTVNLYMAFGDGSDTSWVSIAGNQSFSSVISHYFPFSGLFSVLVNAMTNTGLSASAVAYNLLYVADSCGNITGQVYADQNTNCIFDGSDFYLAGIPVRLSQGGNLFDTYYTDQSGGYYFTVPDALPYAIEIDTDYPGTNTYCPVSGSYTNVVQPSSGNNFAIGPDGSVDLEPSLMISSLSVASLTTVMVEGRNNFFLPANGSLKMIMDTVKFDLISASPAVTLISGDTLIWSGVSMGSTYALNTFKAAVVLSPKPSLSAGDTVCFSAFTEAVANDVLPANNQKTACVVAVPSALPFSKTVDPAGTGPGGNVPPSIGSLVYTISFQNTGSATALNAFILDTIDSNLEINTLQITGSSHTVSISQVGADVIKFGLENIFLPDSSSNFAASTGFISYSISPKQGLPDGTQITNNAGVYFDYFTGLMTNATLTTIDYSLGVINTVSQENSLRVYPVPTSGKISLRYQPDFNGYCGVYDHLGRNVLTAKMEQGFLELNLEELTDGIYFVRIADVAEDASRKIVLIK